MDVVLTGWGYVTFIRFGSPPNDLQRIFLKTETNKQCMRDGMDLDSTGICTQGRLGRGACGVSHRQYFERNVCNFYGGIARLK